MVALVGRPVADWRERLGEKLMSPAEAVAIVRPGDTVFVGLLGSVPMTLCAALVERAAEIAGATILTGLTPFDWDRPEVLAHLQVRSLYAGPVERRAVNEGRIEYIPAASFVPGRMPHGWDVPIDVAAIPISPPDAEGYCSFGATVFFNPTAVEQARTLIGEIHPEYIRTGGQNRVHISKFARLAEAAAAPAPLPIPPRSDETVYAAEVICTLTATELIPDQATLQIGIGDVSAAMCLYLFEKHDLGIHTELLPGGIPALIDAGVVTGKYKEVNAGKVVASLAAQLPPEEMAYIDGNPTFELYDFGYTDDMRLLLRFTNFVAVNNALFVDLTGNGTAETMGSRVFSGPGGQPTFVYAASAVPGGRSILVLPSSQLVDGERQTRIMPTLPLGTTATAHRAFVDYVVTEQGIATLHGKSIRERIGELISVAHPDFRAELKAEAQRIYGFTI